jgi:predicted short-subunit dehydrogenase-like oxidoreductase (DUF2520 family)
MLRVVLIGNGNVAYHLHKALSNSPVVSLEYLAARRPSGFEGFDPNIPRGYLADPLPEADFYLVAVSDKAVAGVARMLAPYKGMVCHTSGALGLEALRENARKGVLYPLQTFSRDREIDFSKVPLCIEAGNAGDARLLMRLAGALSGHVVEADSNLRKRLHLAAVFLNNFSNHMVHLAEALCQKEGLPDQVLKPLLEETFEKLRVMPAYEAQTGPARRGDRESMDAHLLLLDDPMTREVYRLISKSIQRTYDK